MARAADHPGAGQSASGNPAGGREAVRPDCIIATGRSDYPNQVNNALCFPYIFRGALDVGATEINEAMKLACVRAIAELAQDGILRPRQRLRRRRAHVRPRLPDPAAVRPAPADDARAAPSRRRRWIRASRCGRSRTCAAYKEKLGQFIYRTGLMMKPVFDRARGDRQRVVYAEGEEEERAARGADRDRRGDRATPILIGRPDVIETRIERLGLRMRAGIDFELTNIHDDPRFNDYWKQYHALTERRGVTPESAKNLLRSRPTLIAAIDGGARRGRRDDLRAGRPLPQETGLRAQRVRPGPGRAGHLGDDRRDQRAGHVVLPRHPRAGRPDRRADRREHAAGHLPPEAVRRRTEGRAAVAFQFRQPRERLARRRCARCARS